MHKIFVKKYNFLFIFVFFYFVSFTSFSEIIIKGNNNISNKTIESYIPNNFNINDSDSINIFQKNLFLTGFFKNLKLVRDNNDLIIYVEENPIVNFFYIESELKINILEIIKKKISIKENDVFKLYLIKNDIKIINLFLKSLGYLNNEVTYQIIKLENNKVNIFYKIKPNNKYKINRVFFIGDKKFKSSTLADVVLSEEHGWWKFLSNFTTVSEEIINNDISRLKNFYLNEGFYDVQIVSSSIKITSDNKANIVYSINAGNKFFFSKILLNNNSSSLSKQDTIFLEKKIKNKLSKKHYSQLVLKEISSFIDEFSLNNILDLTIKHSIKKISSNKLDINFVIDENKDKKYVNKIIFSGNSITDDFVLRNFFPFSEGDVLPKRKLILAVDKINGSGLFEKVSYKLQPLNNNEDKVDLIVNINEKPTGEISAGAGAGSSGAVISAGLKEKNFLGKGITIDSFLNIGTQKNFGKISYIDPDFQNSSNIFRYGAFIENNSFKDSSFENKLIGNEVSFKYEVFDNFYFNPGAVLDYDVVDVSSSASNALKRREGNFLTSKVNYNLIKDTRNRTFNPTNGFSFGFGQDLSALLSDISYINNRIFGSYYNNYKDDLVASIKYKIESINGFNDDIKFSDRLFVSSNYLRGFDERGIGPKIENDFVGGNYSYYSTFSTTFPNGLPEKWNATTNIFSDFANVWGVDDNNIKDSNKLRSSLGIGFSWLSPLGPISVSYAEPILKSDTDDIQQFNFKIGTAF